MFVVDAFIGNPDRNNSNWGFLVTFPDRKIVDIAPVYNNGNCLNCKWNNAMMQNFMKRASKTQRINRMTVSAYLDDKGERIHPFEYIKNTNNQDCINSFVDIY